MTTTFDQHAINDMTVAIHREMTPQGRDQHADRDVLFMGGQRPSNTDQDALARFGLNKNYNMIFPSFDPGDPAAGPVAFHAVITDGLEQSFVLSGGRLWKRDRRSPAVLLFPGIQAVVKLSSKSRLTVLEMKGQLHDHGYELALEAVRARASRKPGRAPVVSPIGGMLTVLDITRLSATFAAAG